MLDKIFEIFTRDASELSTTNYIFIFLGAFLFVALNIFLIYVCRAILKQSGKKSYTAIKILMIAVFPTIFNSAAVFGHLLPIKLTILLTIIMSIIVVVWNFLQFGPIGGLMFSFLHIVGGLGTGLIVAGFVLVVFFAIVVIFVGRPQDVIPKESNVGLSPRYVEEIGSGEVYEVTINDGVAMIIKYGSWMTLYSGDSFNHFRDRYGNVYIGRYD